MGISRSWRASAWGGLALVPVLWSFFGAGVGPLSSFVCVRAAAPQVSLEIGSRWTALILDETYLASAAAGGFGDRGESRLLLKMEGEGAGFAYTVATAARTADREKPYGRVEWPEVTLARRWGPVVVEVGKRPLGWGKGFIARPSFPLREGKSYWIASADLPFFEQVAGAGAAWEEWGDARPLFWGRTSWLFASSDLALGWYGGPGRRGRTAADYSVDLAGGWAAYSELGLQQGSDRLYPTGDPLVPLAAGKAGEERLYPHWLGGLEYLSPSGVIAVLEVYYQSDGYSGEEAERFWQLARQPRGAGAVLGQLQEGELLRQNYAALAVTRAAGGDWTWQVSHLAGLDDGSSLSRAQLTYAGEQDLELGAEVARFAGKEESEFGALARWEITISVKSYF